MKIIRWIVAIAALLSFLFLYTTGFWDSPAKRLQRVLSSGKGMAPLPKSATNVAFNSWNGLFAGEAYAKFQASPEDVHAFIESSLDLSNKPEDVFSASHQLLPKPAGRDLDPKHAYFERHPRMPAWFSPRIQGTGRHYFIWPRHRVYIDQDRHTVWLHFVKG